MKKHSRGMCNEHSRMASIKMTVYTFCYWPVGGPGSIPSQSLIYGEQCGTGRSFSPSASVSLVTIFPPSLQTHSFITVTTFCWELTILLRDTLKKKEGKTLLLSTWWAVSSETWLWLDTVDGAAWSVSGGNDPHLPVHMFQQSAEADGWTRSVPCHNRVVVIIYLPLMPYQFAYAEQSLPAFLITYIIHPLLIQVTVKMLEMWNLGFSQWWCRVFKSSDMWHCCFKGL